MVAGAFAANSSSIFCLAASFIESPMLPSIDAMSKEASEKSLLNLEAAKQLQTLKALRQTRVDRL